MKVELCNEAFSFILGNDILDRNLFVLAQDMLGKANGSAEIFVGISDRKAIHHFAPFGWHGTGQETGRIFRSCTSTWWVNFFGMVLVRTMPI